MHTGNWKWGLFRVVDLIVVSVMILSNPLTVFAAVTDVATDSDAADSQVVPLLEVEPLDISPAIEEAPAVEQAVKPEEAWNTLASTLNLAGPQSPALDGSGNADVQYGVGCMQESAGFNLQCTANDISIASAKNITILDDGCAYPGDTVTFKADFEVLLTAQARYDVGLWFAQDGDPNGDAAKTGTCTTATPAYAPDPPWRDLDQLVSGQENDTCGDIDDNHNPLFPSVTLTVSCVDDDANGKLDLPNCTSWRQPGDNSLCTSPVQAVPGAPSKCKCDIGFNVNIPVPGQIIVDKVTSPAGLATSFDFTLTGTPTGGSAITPVTFSLTDASTPFKSTNLMGGTYSVVETANSSYMTSATCSDGSPANAIALAPGEIVTCTFTNTLQTGTLIVQKNLVNDNSGTKTCADFSFSVDSGTTTAFESDCSNSVTVLAGSHSVVEMGVPIDGYTTSYNNCTNVNVPAGGTATCTITNDDVAIPGMTVEKSSATTNLTAPGTVTYSYLVTNTGNTSLTGIALSDNNDNNDMSCPKTTLAKSESMVCTATHTFTQAELDAGGTLDNIVTADSDQTDPVTDSLSIPITKTAALMVDKSSTTSVITAAGQVVPYTFVVTNEGNVTLTGITVIDSMCDAAPAYQTGDTNTDSKLQVDETWTYTCSHTVTQAEMDAGGSLSNTVTADSNESEPDTDTVDIPISQSHAIIVVKASTTVEVVEAGQVVPYTFTVDNNGNTTLTGISVSDPMCDAAPAYQSGDDGDGKLQVDETWIYTCNHTVTQAEIDSKGGGDLDLDNTVTADSNESAPDTDDHSIPIDYYPFLTVEKSSTTTSLSAPGTVTYSYLVTNTGNVTLTGIVLSDNNDNDDMSCPATTLAPEGSMTCTATHTFTQAELDTLSSLDNTVTAASTEAPDATDNLSIPISKSAAIIVVKASTIVEIVEAGQVVPYTFTVDNDGNTTLTGVTVTDLKCDAAPVLISGDGNNDGMLQVDETWIYTCNHTVTQAEIDSNGGGDGDLDNTVTADSNESAPDTDEHAIPVDYNPVLSVEKSSTTTEITAAGQVVPYTFVVTNTGNVTLTVITVSDEMCDAAPAYQSGDGNTDSKLDVDETWTYTCSHTVTQAEMDAGGNLSNTVTADSYESGPDTASLDIPIVRTAAINVEKSSTTTAITTAGQIVPYTFVVTNADHVTLTGITVTDENCDAAPVYVSGDDNNDSKLQIAETWTYTCSHTVTQAEVDAGGNLSNIVMVDSNESEPDIDTFDIPVTRSPALTIVKTATPATYDAVGDIISYSYLVTNSGNVTLYNITVVDDKATATCPDTSAGLVPAGTITCTATYTITQADVDSGSVTNTAYATNGTIQSPPDSETVTADKLPALTIVKTASPTTYAAVGNVISYSYLVTNSGNVTLYNITVVDNKASVTCPDTSLGLAPAGTITCTASYTIAQADLDAGSVTNSAYATDGTTQSQPDTETVTAMQGPALTLDKTANPTEYDSVGDVISYSYLLTNSGNVTLTGPFTVDDTKAAVTCPSTPASLIPGASITCTASYTITQDDLDYGSVMNSALGHAFFGTTPVDSNPDTQTVNAVPNPALAIVKTATPTTYDSVGDVIGYSYLVTNTGNITLYQITVEDDKAAVTCEDTTEGLPPLGTITCTASYTITQADLDAGSVTNTAYATDGTTDSAPDSETVTAVQTPLLSLTKAATEQSFNAPGVTLHYTLVATNDGNVTLTNVIISDAKLGTLTCTPEQPAALAPAQTLTCTGTYLTTQADVDFGRVDNTANASGIFNGSPVLAPPADETVPAIQTPGIDANKDGVWEDGNGDGFADVGETIHYTFSVQNTGNVTLTNVTITDPIVTVVGGPITLAPGQIDSTTFTATYIVTQADVDAGHVYNKATVTGTPPVGPPVVDEPPTDTPLPQNPAISLVKTGTFGAGADGYANVGEQISYSFLVTNEGNVTLTGVTVTDPKVSPISCPATTLAVGDSMTCTGTYAVTQADIDAGSVYNLATADSEESGPDEDDFTTPLPQNPALALDKTGTFDAGADGYANVGELISYEFLVTNEGNVTLTGITVTDPKVSNISCPADTLAVGASMTCTGTYAVTQVDIDAGFVYNLATADSTESGPDDGDNNEPLPQNPAISLVKTGTFGAGADGYANVDELISYEFLVTNEGNVTLTGVTVTDPKVSNILCPADTLAVGTSMTCTGSYAVTQADIDAGSVYNLATADSEESGPDDGENTEPLPQNPALILDKTGTFDAGADGFANVGELISYEFTVTNIGNVTLTGVTVTDPLVSTITCTDTTIQVGGSVTCTGTYAVTQADIDAGFVLNLATADSTQSGPDDDDHNQPLPQNPAISLVKSGTFGAGADGYANAGELISYSFLVTNEGNVTLTGITVTDPKVSPISCPATTLAVGDSMTCTGTYAVTQADIDAGFVYNLATADSNESEPDDGDNNEPLPQNPAISLVKTGTFDAGADGFANVGELISYEFEVTNSGNVTLTGVTVTDPKVSNILCPADTLAVGASMTCTGTYAVTQVDIDAGSVYNLATADSTQSGPDDDDETETLPQNPALMLVKTGTFGAGADGFANVGELISYEFTVTNTGNVTLTGVTVTDPKVSPITCPADTLAVGASVTCTGTYAVTQVDIDAGSVYNLATADSTQSGPDTDDHNQPLPQNPVINIVKTGTFGAGADGYANVGEQISYSFLVTNEGNVTLTGVTVTDPKVLNISCPATTLAVGASMTCTGSYTVTQTDIDAGSVYNLATADSTQSGPDTDDETVILPQNPAISLTKSAAPQTYDAVGDIITYTLVAKNTGNVTLHDVSISDPKLSALTCTPNQPATLAPNATLTCTGTYTIKASDLVVGQVNNVTNTATVNGKGPQDQPVTATATATVYQQTGALLPTQTTCQQYAAGPSAWPAMYDAFTYQVKANKINSVAPGVIFYYNTITAPSASFTLNVVQNNSKFWKPMLIQDLGQAILYTSNCSKAPGVTVTTSTSGSTYTVTFNVTGATPGAVYYIGIKYSPQNLIGQSVPGKPTSIYSFNTTGYIGGEDSIAVKPKK